MENDDCLSECLPSFEKELDTEKINPGTTDLQSVKLPTRKSEITLNPEYSTDELLSFMYKFQAVSLAYTDEELKKRARRLKRHIIKFDEDCMAKSGNLFSIDFIEHAHYIYSLKGFGSELDEQDYDNIEEREMQFDEISFPHEHVYSEILRFFEFISTLMIRWKIFDMNNYGYRYKGRSLTVKIIDMKTINKQCVNANIAWFTYAINHQPFVEKIEKVIVCYAKVFQMQMNKAIKFFRDNDFRDCNFEIAPWWKLKTKTHPTIKQLYNLLKEVELSNRYFEKSLIQEFLRIV